MEGPGPEPVNGAIRAQCGRWQLGTPPSRQQPRSPAAWLSSQAAAAAYAPGVCSPTECAHVMFSPFRGNEWNAQKQEQLPEFISTRIKEPVWHMFLKDHGESLRGSSYSFKATATMYQMGTEMTSCLLLS